MIDLIERLSVATGPSLELDGQIWCAVNGYEFVMWDGAGCVYRDPKAPKWDAGIKHAQASIVRPYSASVDAAIALAERVLPGCDICTQDVHADFRQDGEPRHVAEIMTDLGWKVFDGPPEPVYAVSGSGKSNSRAIAILIAVLTAKQAEGQNP